MARLGFRLSIDGLEDDTLVVREYQGHDGISDSRDNSGNVVYGFRYQIELASRRNDLTAEQTVDRKALLEVFRDGEVVQQVHGIIRQFCQGDTGYSHTFYSVTLVPALERLSLRHNSRIFQQQTVPEILSILLQEMKVTDYTFSLKRDPAPREFCVQYRETDLAFFHRLAAEEGIVYSFVHSADKHLLYLSDSSESLPSLTEAVPYNALSGGASEVSYISTFTQYTQAEISHTVLQDNSFKRPGYTFAQFAQAQDSEYQRAQYEHFDMPGRFKDDATGKAFNQIRLEYLRRTAHTATGASDHPAIQAGFKFTLSDHLDEALNRDWVVIYMTHQGKQPQALEEAANGGETTYHNQFTLIPDHLTWRAAPCSKPKMRGPTSARVVGPEGEEIYCDEHGRVKLHFSRDRYSNGDEHSSCWVRVSQGWAGAQYGMMALPRIGHEVIVSFINGDPDQPMVTGRAYNANNRLPYSLPEHKTKTVLRTETHQGSGYNELSFEDQSGREQIYLHGQKDYQALIENDQLTQTRHDQYLTIANDRYSEITANDHLSVNGEQRQRIGQTQSLTISGDLYIKSGSVYVNDAGTEIHIKAGQKVVIEAGTEISVKAGGSFVKVDPSGVSLGGAGVNLNSGGSAGSGSGYGGQKPMKPSELINDLAIAELAQPEITATMQSAQAVVQQAPLSINYLFSA